MKTKPFGPKETVLFITSYPPRECGIATFSQDLIAALAKQFGGHYNYEVCALKKTTTVPRKYDPIVKHTLNAHDKADCMRFAEKINNDKSVRSS